MAFIEFGDEDAMKEGLSKHAEVSFPHRVQNCKAQYRFNLIEIERPAS